MRLAICMATCMCTIIIIPVEGGILVAVGAKVGNSVVGAATAFIYEKGKLTYCTCIIIIKPVMVSVAGGVDSGGFPSIKCATHITIVPLYFDLVGMVSVYTTLPFSLIEPELMLGNCTTDEPFTLHPIIASDDV